MFRRKKEDWLYFWVSLGLVLLANLISFQGSRLFTHGLFHHDLSLSADAAVPFLPWTIVIYFGCFGAWFLFYCYIAGLPRERADRFFCSNILGKAVCLLFFLFLPTTMARPDVSGPSFWEFAMRFLYSVDTPDNLFPSIHCLNSWLCWAGVRGNRVVPFRIRAAALITAIFVCLSTLTVRQHVLVDVLSGILLAEITYLLSSIPAVRGVFSRLTDQIIQFLQSVFSSRADRS
ncbi:MAG: phosphatase PAP2 family protein [Oscillospiraceae bacterium]|nr:phosphatase PAP2 family protein [Oscillospiraceae bacterium]